MSPPSKNRGRHPSHPPPPQLEQLQQSAGQSLPQPGQQQPVQQGVNQLQKAAAYNNQARPERTSAVTTASGTNTPGAGASGQGQVELGDAATFMDKVKNRFAHQPEIYGNFLETIQNNHREDKLLQDAYPQVAQLLWEAPDLLDEFKEFLPDPAAQAYGVAADAESGCGVMSGVPPTVAGSQRNPTVGPIPPPLSVSKRQGKEREGPVALQPLDFKVERGDGVLQAVNENKAAYPNPSEQQIVAASPTMSPSQHETMASTSAIATADELAFFDGVKKYIGNKQTYTEFLKLLKLFSQGLMEKAALYDKLLIFIGGNKELLEWFKKFIQLDYVSDEIRQIPHPMNLTRSKICRSQGPSYRLLPKLEAQKLCSGRDEMCNEVLNDEWASHPTWTSGYPYFGGHQKNQYEDICHRIEEERYEYDFNIETNRATIELLVPIAERISTMSAEEKSRFRLTPGLGGQSKTIYQRVIKKVWGREAGLGVIDALHGDPVRAVPLVLSRLRKMNEVWITDQQGWQKVWREQMARVFEKSLDYQGIAIKQTDKKQFLLKTLVAEIAVNREEQMTRRLHPAPEYQLAYDFEDKNVILDVCRLLSVSRENGLGNSSGDGDKIDGFLRSFIPLLFGINSRGEGVTVSSSSTRQAREYEGRRLRKRTVFTLFCNATIYGFVRGFQILYDRLAAVKATEDQIRAEVQRRKTVGVHGVSAVTHRIDAFPDTSPTANYYGQILDLCEKVLNGELNATGLEETLRSANVQQCWKLFTVDTACSSILKLIQNIVPSDGNEINPAKEKSADIIRRFQKDRINREYEKEGGEYRELTEYRKAVEGILGISDDLYRIDWHETDQKMTIRLIPRGPPTDTAEVDSDHSFQQYIAAYKMSSPTEGIPYHQCSKVFLRRGLPKGNDVQKNSRKMTILKNMETCISPDSYRITFLPHTPDLWVMDPNTMAPVPEGSREARRKMWRKKLGSLGWMREAKPEDIESKQRDWEAFLQGSKYLNRHSVERGDSEDSVTIKKASWGRMEIDDM